MTDRHRPGGAGIAMVLVAAATTWLSLLAWRGFTAAPIGYLVPLGVLALLIAGIGLAARSLLLPRWLVPLVQLAALVGFCCYQYAGSFLPDPASLTALRDALAEALSSAQRFAAPVPTNAPSVHPLLVVGGGCCLLLVDVAVATVRRASLAALPLLAVYTVPVSVVGGVPGWVFAAGALGFCVTLLLQEADSRARWGKAVAEERLGQARSTVGAGGVAVAAICLALLAPPLVPTTDFDLIGFGRGAGGDDTVSLENPIADLRRDLRRGEDIPLVTVRTEQPDPAYLRTSVLTRFAGNTWSPGDRQVPSTQTARGQMPPLIGVRRQLPRTEHDWGIRVTEEFTSTWLPVPSPISRVNAAGGWRYDLDTMDFMAHEEDLDTAGMQYSARAVQLDLDAVAMSQARPGRSAVGPEMTELPENLPEVVRERAEEVTSSAGSDFERAVALQQWFREDGDFTYSLDTATGSGNDELVEFLEERVGYCEQFSAAMAVMARSLDIPARVAIGFLRPEQLSGNLYEFSSHDLHAWPELYITGAGWVAFEPTPAARAESAPGYTTQRIPERPDPDTPTGQPSAEAPDTAPTAAPELPEEPETGVSDSEEGGRLGWTALVLLLLAAGLVGLLLTPRLIRARRRRERWAATTPAAAWAEVRDSALDHGLRWPEGLSPRATATVVSSWFAAPSEYDDPVRPERGPRTNPDAMRALDRLVELRERTLYSPHEVPADAEAVHDDAERCIAGFRAGTYRRARRRADWWPVSALRRSDDDRAFEEDRALDHLAQ